MEKRNLLVSFVMGVLLLIQGSPLKGGELDSMRLDLQHQRIIEWRRLRDEFFKNHERSPLMPGEKRAFKGLNYYPFDPGYIFHGQIERYIFYINDPMYYAILPTNKGTHKRYIRYGKFRFVFEERSYSIEIYKSILSDYLLISFKDKTNGRETYDGGRYVDAEILAEYKTVLDFNMAYHPPCAYNDRLICTLPPRENMLDISILAGEKNLH